MSPIAIDFGDDVVRLLQVDQTTGAVHAAARVAYDAEHPERAAEVIAGAIKGEGFSGDGCVVGLPFDIVRTDTLCVAEGHDSDVRAAIDAALRRSLELHEPQIGFIRLAPVESGRVEVVAVAAERARLEALLTPLFELGLMPDAAEPSFLAVARACSRVFRRESDRSRVRLALETSRHGATAMLLAGDRIAYARSTRDFGQVATVAAECLRDGQRFVAEAQRPTEIRISGVFAELEQLTRDLERRTGLPVRLDDDRSTIGLAWRAISARISREDRPWAWSSALGLAYRSAGRSALRALANAQEREAA